MRYTTVSYYGEFHCIGGSCEDSCCEHWEIDLDEASLKLYMKQKGEFGKRLKDCTRVRDRQFILNGTRCPFLNQDNLCDIYLEMGEESLCRTCTNFPRHIEEFDDLKEVSLTMSCPEASRIMLAKPEKMHFVCREGTDAEYGLKPEAQTHPLAFWKRGKGNRLDKPLFDVLQPAREYLYFVLQDRRKGILERAYVLLLLGAEFQEWIDAGQYERIAERIRTLQETGSFPEYDKAAFDDRPAGSGRMEEAASGRKPDSEHAAEMESSEKAAAEGLKSSGKAAAGRERWMKEVLNMYQGLETIREEWKTLLADGMKRLYHLPEAEYRSARQEFTAYYSQLEYEFEHILVYYVFQYFLGAAYDHDVLTRVKFAVVSLLVIMELDLAVWLKKDKQFTYEDQVMVAHAYSKEVEHSYDNFEALWLVLSAHPVLDTEHIRKGLNV